MFTNWFSEIGINDLELVGGKNASLGEMYTNLTQKGIQIPNGFVITTTGYAQFIKHNNLEEKINKNLEKLYKKDKEVDLVLLKRVGLAIRTDITNGVFPDNIKNEILQKYTELSNSYKDSFGEPQAYTDVAVRSSSTAEDLPGASFAGLQETYLNVRGNNQLLESIKNCFASLYTDRAISYRITLKIFKVNISVCIQKMVRSDLGSSGVSFSIDTESGFKDVILINSSWGLGEMVVGGKVKPDEVLVFKPTLSDGFIPIIDKIMGHKTHKMIYGTNPDQKTKIVEIDSHKKKLFSIDDVNILRLAKWVTIIEEYYSNKNNRWTPMDIEWAIDGLSGDLFIVQARPETIFSKKNPDTIQEFKLKTDISTLKPLLTGISVGNKIASGKVKIIHSLDTRENVDDMFNEGDILVTDITDPDWEPIMKKSSAIITNKGGRTCHAAIVARELGVPAIVGTENCTEILDNNKLITVCCAFGEQASVYNGKLEYETKNIDLKSLPKINTKLMMNVGSPSSAFIHSFLPNCGVGLAREEFIINNFIKVHPLALLKHNELNDSELSNKIKNITAGYKNEEDFFIKKLSYGISRIASAFYPNEVIVRFSDFKSNEYRNLLGGSYFEPIEENPMIGWRGCSRYYSEKYMEAFKMECEAIKLVRNIMGLKNVVVMLPFCRTPLECKKVLNTMKKFDLERGIYGLKVYLMCEIPSNVILAEQFFDLVDGFSIGSNDLTQLVLGLDRDSHLVSHIYDERNEAVKIMLSNVIKTAKRKNKKIGICGQGPSDFPDFAEFLVKEGIDTISLTPDSIVNTIYAINKIEKEQK